MEFKYMVSFHAQKQMERIIKPKWWQFWKKPETINYMEWMRYSMSLYKDEGDLLLADTTYISPVWRLLVRALASVDVKSIKFLQIEYITSIGRVSNYVTTEGTKE